MNERIKAVRRHYHLTMSAFGSRIGIKNSSISLLESGKNNPSERTILAICREFNVNEEWLRTGKGDMFNQDEPSILARLSGEYKLTQREEAVIAAFLELSDTDRAAIMRYVDNLVAKLAPPGISDASAEAVAATRDYLDMVADEKNTEEGSSTSAG